MPKTLFKYARKMHKFMGILLVLQLFFWIAGGFIMSAIPLEKVHGKHLAVKQTSNPFQPGDYQAQLQQVIQDSSLAISKIEFSHRMNRPVFVVHAETRTYLFDAQNAERIAGLGASDIESIAQQHYLGDAPVISTVLLKNAPQEASSNRAQLWQVKFDDFWNTTLYLTPDGAEVQSVRSDIWRLFDIVWMLHIMDYDERDDFNNPLLIGFAFAALLFTMSGAVLLFQQFRIKPASKRRMATNK